MNPDAIRAIHIGPRRPGRTLLAVLGLACAGLATAHAATIRYGAIGEKVSSSDTFVVAGGNDTGPVGSEERLGSSLSFAQALFSNVVDRNEDQGTSASAISLVNQTTTLAATSVMSTGQVSAGVDVAIAGLARAEGLSSFETSLTVDADVAFSFGIGVSCADTACQASVSLFGPGGSLLVGRSVTGGVDSASFEGMLRAGQAYRIVASAHDLVWLSGPSSAQGTGGSYSFEMQLMNGPGGMVPEPASAALLAAGLAGLAWRRRTLRSKAPAG